MGFKMPALGTILSGVIVTVAGLLVWEKFIKSRVL